MRVESVLDLIGGTPLVGIHQLSPKPSVRIYAKLEGQNPTGSVRNRVAWSMIQAAERDGVLTPGATFLEPTSGNTGIGLALIARLRGYRMIAVMPANASPERKVLLEMFGAEVIDSPAEGGSNGAVRLAQELVKEHGHVFLNQYANPANVAAHYTGTGPEIWQDCPEVTAFAAGLGTTGTLMGVGRYLKERNPAIQIIAAEPPAGELVQGLRSLDDGYTPEIFDPGVLDRRAIVRPKPSVLWVRRLLDDCGIFAGLSSGAAVSAAVKYAESIEAGTIVVLLPDGGWKYLSSGAWTDDLDVLEDRMTKIVYW